MVRRYAEPPASRGSSHSDWPGCLSPKAMAPSPTPARAAKARRRRAELNRRRQDRRTWAQLTSRQRALLFGALPESLPGGQLELPVDEP